MCPKTTPFKKHCHLSNETTSQILDFDPQILTAFFSEDMKKKSLSLALLKYLGDHREWCGEAQIGFVLVFQKFFFRPKSSRAHSSGSLSILQ